MKSTMQPVNAPDVRTYRNETGTIARGVAVMQGTADDQAKAVTGAGVKVLGVTQESGSVAGEPLPVVINGETIAIAGTTGVTAGQHVKNEATTGRFVNSTGEDAEVAGKALSTQATDGGEFLIFVNPIQKRSA
jgi:hypothetical protein